MPGADRARGADQPVDLLRVAGQDTVAAAAARRRGGRTDRDRTGPAGTPPWSSMPSSTRCSPAGKPASLTWPASSRTATPALKANLHRPDQPTAGCRDRPERRQRRRRAGQRSGRDHHRVVQDRADPPTLTLARSGRGPDRRLRVGRLLQHRPTPRLPRRPNPPPGRGTPLRSPQHPRHDRMRHQTEPPDFPGRLREAHPADWYVSPCRRRRRVQVASLRGGAVHPWQLARAPVTRRSNLAHEELIQAELLAAEVKSIRNPGGIEGRPGRVRLARTQRLGDDVRL